MANPNWCHQNVIKCRILLSDGYSIFINTVSSNLITSIVLWLYQNAGMPKCLIVYSLHMELRVVANMC